MKVDLLQKTVEEVDVDGSGEIDFAEFLKLFRKLKNREYLDLEKCFQSYNKNLVKIAEEERAGTMDARRKSSIMRRESSIRLQAVLIIQVWGAQDPSIPVSSGKGSVSQYPSKL